MEKCLGLAREILGCEDAKMQKERILKMREEGFRKTELHQDYDPRMPLRSKAVE